MNALIVDTEAEGANYGSEAEFLSQLTRQVFEWSRLRKVAPREAVEVLAAGLRSHVGRTMKVRVIAFNDFHGNLQSPGTFGVQAGGPGTAIVNQPAGGIEFLAGYVAAQKTGHPNNVVVSPGDLIGASPLISALFHDEPSIETMNRLGLEFNAVGNHEFDDGRDELLRMQHGGCHPTDQDYGRTTPRRSGRAWPCGDGPGAWEARSCGCSPSTRRCGRARSRHRGARAPPAGAPGR